MSLLKQNVSGFTTPTKKVRSSVEYNGMELVVPILLKYNVTNFHELVEKIQHMRENMDTYAKTIILNEPSDFEKYVEDIQKKEKIIIKSNYITKFKELIKTHSKFESNNITSIYISGKTNKHAKIAELNKNIKKIEAKSDIYVEFVNGEICGVSIKQSKDATKSNYSVHKILGQILGQEFETNLNNTKIKYLNDNGILNFDKNERAKVNKLFYSQNKNNLYWEQLREIFANKNAEISKKLVELLYCSNITSYDIYEYDGDSFEKMNHSNDCFTNSNISFEEYKPYYFDKKGKERHAAKMFCRLIVDDKIYRVEIRWKGNIYNSSPQFQIHNE
jgi:hypothetical protein